MLLLLPFINMIVFNTT